MHIWAVLRIPTLVYKQHNIAATATASGIKQLNIYYKLLIRFHNKQSAKPICSKLMCYIVQQPSTNQTANYLHNCGNVSMCEVSMHAICTLHGPVHSLGTDDLPHFSIPGWVALKSSELLELEVSSPSLGKSIDTEMSWSCSEYATEVNLAPSVPDCFGSGVIS